MHDDGKDRTVTDTEPQKDQRHERKPRQRMRDIRHRADETVQGGMHLGKIREDQRKHKGNGDAARDHADGKRALPDQIPLCKIARERTEHILNGRYEER